MSRYLLYGDGVHDDTDAIQEMLDSGINVVYLPTPKDKYLISRTLIIGSNTTLRMDITTKIRLADGSSCLMLQNKNRYTKDENIAVIGGIWDMNNQGQRGNPLILESEEINEYLLDNREYGDKYLGVMMRFSHISGLLIRDVIFKDPVTFCVQMANMNDFTIENIRFDFNMGNPLPLNMDGIHLDGCCRQGIIRNLKGTCYDDLVALNADDCGVFGAIEDINIDGIFAENCHSAVRMLSTGSPLRNIHISNIYGTYYQYCIGFTHHYSERKTRGIFENVSVDHNYASKAPRPGYLQKDDQEIYAPVYVGECLTINRLSIFECCRRETNVASEYIVVKRSAQIDNLSVINLFQENKTGKKCPILLNQGRISNLHFFNVNADRDECLVNEGRIKFFKE